MSDRVETKPTDAATADGDRWTVRGVSREAQAAARDAAEKARCRNIGEWLTPVIMAAVGAPDGQQTPASVAAANGAAIRLTAPDGAAADLSAEVSALERVTGAMVSLRAATGEPLDPKTIAALETTARSIAAAARPKRRKGASDVGV